MTSRIQALEPWVSNGKLHHRLGRPFERSLPTIVEATALQCSQELQRKQASYMGQNQESQYKLQQKGEAII
jgi:hypothetical protein